MELPLDGGPAVVLASTGSLQANGLAVSGTSVYWTDFRSGAIESIPIGGGTATTITTGENQPQLMAIDSNNVYWAVESGLLDSGSIMAVPLDGGPAFTVTGGGIPVGVVAWGAGTIGYTNDTWPGGSIQSISLDGGNALTVATDVTYPTSIVEQGGSYFFLAQGDGGNSPRSVWTVSVTGGTAQLLYPATGAAHMAVDATHVFWTDNSVGAVYEAPLFPTDGAAPIVIASGLSGPDGIALGGGFVYWTNDGDGTVMRAPIQ